MFIGINNAVRNYAITPNGIKEINDLVEGDNVYEFNTNRLLTVRDVIRIGPVDIYEVEYTDGRSILVAGDGLVYTDTNSAFHVEDILNFKNIGHITTKPLDFNLKVRRPLYPDPYIVGALLLYGDFGDPYMNMPLYMESYTREMSNKYKLDYGLALGNNKIYFSWDDKPSSVLIKWKEFLKGHDCYVTTGKLYSPPVPKEYLYSSIKDRSHFVMGCFDNGYDNYYHPNRVTVMSDSYDKLKILGWIINSLGLSYKIENISMYKNESDMMLNVKYNREYVLTILGSKDQYPGFFYDRNNIENFIKCNDNYYDGERFELKIKSVTKLNIGFISNIITDIHNAVYYDNNFLPKVTL